MYKHVFRTNTKGQRPQDRVNLLQDLCCHRYGSEWGSKIFDQNFKWLMATDFFEAPASTKYHGTYAGGLFDHSMNVAKVLLWLTNEQGICTWDRPESPLFVGILHDATKIGQYLLTQDMNPETGEMEPVYIWNKEHLHESKVHGEDSILVVCKHALMSPEERACIRFHMGAYETEDWPQYDLAIRKYPNVLWTHTADMIASKLMEGDMK